MASYALPDGFDDFDMFAFGSVLLVGAVLGFFLNLVSVMAYLRVKELRTPSNFFVFNLALADLSLNCNGLASAYASYLRYWPFGPEGCQIHGVQGMVSILAGISFLGAVAWDRYHMYCTKQKMFWSTSLTISTILWGLAIFWAVLPLPSIGWGVFDFEPMKVGCTLDYTRGDRDYITYMLSITFLYLVFPLFIMHSSYNAIYAYFKKTHNFKYGTPEPSALTTHFQFQTALQTTQSFMGWVSCMTTEAEQPHTSLRSLYTMPGVGWSTAPPLDTGAVEPGSLE
ncbi:hypothetical protein NFI96_002037 [Prochilodus magdalenae]|nr:hypothetical protein NFI96_002037 [Prochilodus magdalenae]